MTERIVNISTSVMGVVLFLFIGFCVIEYPDFRAGFGGFDCCMYVFSSVSLIVFKRQGLKDLMLSFSDRIKKQK